MIFGFMEIMIFPKDLPDDNYVSIAALVHLSEEDKEDPFVPQMKSHGYPTGVEEQLTAAWCATLRLAFGQRTSWTLTGWAFGSPHTKTDQLGLWLSPHQNAQD